MATHRWYTALIAAMFLCGAAAFFVPIYLQMDEVSDDASAYADVAKTTRMTTPSQSSPTSSIPPSMAEEKVALPPTATSSPPSAPLPIIDVTTTDSSAFNVDMDALREQNPDFVAWLNIPDTAVDYPVVRSDKTDYYLHTMFNGKRSKLGCLFSLTSSDYERPSKNIAIYGHHLSHSDAMFSTLLHYKSIEYWRAHPTVTLETFDGFRTYTIFAVVNQLVTEWDASTASFANDDAFAAFVNRARQRAIYDTGIDVTPDDHILTLITCDRSYGGIRGRLLVMGVDMKGNH